MGINKSNYEAYFLDYFENTLQPEQVAELMVFLEANPDLNAEFESFQPVKIEAENLSFETKNSLKKKNFKETGKVNVYNYEQIMISDLEGDLSENETAELKTFMKVNPDARLDYNLFKKSRLLPEDIQFHNKIDLKKKGMYFLYRAEINTTLAIAATLLIFLAVYLRSGDLPDRPEITRNVTIPSIPSIQAERISLEKTNTIPVRSEFADRINTLSGSVPLWDNTSNPKIENLDPLLSLNFNENLSPGQDELIYIMSRTVNTDLFDDNIVYESEEVKRPSFALRFFKGSLSKLFVNENRSKKSLLEYTVSGYNLMTDREVAVEKQYDASGKLVAYHINGELIKIGRKVSPAGSE